RHMEQFQPMSAQQQATTVAPSNATLGAPRIAVKAKAVEPTGQARPDLVEKVVIRGMSFFYKDYEAVRGINLVLYDRHVTAFIGPSGCGKSTLLRTLNRIYDLYPGQRVTGEVLLDGHNILGRNEDLNRL